MLSAYVRANCRTGASLFWCGRRNCERQGLSVMDKYPIYLALPEARATSSSTFESKSFKIGERFDFL
jgi:hypothetical protein